MNDVTVINKQKSLRHAIVEAASMDDLDDAALVVMEALGVTSSDAAAVFFDAIEGSDGNEAWKRLDRDRREVSMVNYARYEMNGLLTYRDPQEVHSA